MRPFRLAILLLAAAILIVEPVVHTHPLFGATNDGMSTPSFCAVCAVGTHRIVITAAPSVFAPATVIEHLIAIAHAAHFDASVLPSASRAPPAA